jgi:predicted transcriptional regulator
VAASKRRVKRPWTEREDALICKMREADSAGSAAIAARLRNRTRSAVECRIEYLLAQGRIAPLSTPPKKRRPSGTSGWTPLDDAIIVDLRARGTGHIEIAAHFPRRTPGAVAGRISKLIRQNHLERQREGGLRHHPWTQKEAALLVKMRADDATLDEIAAALPHRTRLAISTRIAELIEAGVIERTHFAPQSRRRWSREEDQLVAEMRRAKKTMEEMAATLGRSLASVNSRIAQRVRKGELQLL